MSWRKTLQEGQAVVGIGPNLTYVFGVVTRVGATLVELRSASYGDLTLLTESVLYPISDAQYAVARQHGWPTGEREVMAIVGWKAEGGEA